MLFTPVFSFEADRRRQSTMAIPKLRQRTYVASARVALRLSRLVRTSFPSGFRLSYCRRYRAHLLTNFADLRQLLCHRGRGDTLRLGVPERVSFPCVRWRRPRVSSRRHDGGRFLFPDTATSSSPTTTYIKAKERFDAHIKRLPVCMYVWIVGVPSSSLSTARTICSATPPATSKSPSLLTHQVRP